MARSVRVDHLGNAARTDSFTLRDPSEPVTTAMKVRSALTPSEALAVSRSVLRLMARTSARTGLPVTTLRGRSVSTKGTALAFANRPASLLAAPARAFCSMTTIGTRQMNAPTVHATLAYPPRTRTTLGRRRRTRTIPFTTARIRPQTAAIFSKVSRRWIPRPGNNVRSNPASGTSVRSRPRSLPTK